MKSQSELSREALKRFRDSVDLEEAFDDPDEITQNLHVHIPRAPRTPTIAKSEDAPTTKLKALIASGGVALGTGIVIGILQHCGH